MQQYASVRTTLDLPEKLLRQAKIAAVERGTTLRELVGHALARELNSPTKATQKRRRTTFPIFNSSDSGTLSLTNAKLAQLEAEEDARRHGLAN